MHGKKKDCILYEGRFKGLPLHSACGYGWFDAVEKLVEWDNSTFERSSVPVILPAFTSTTEPREFDQVYYTWNEMVNLNSLSTIRQTKTKL